MNSYTAKALSGMNSYTGALLIGSLGYPLRVGRDRQ